MAGHDCQYSGKLIGNAPVAGGWRQLHLQQPQLAALTRPGQQIRVLLGETRLTAYASRIGESEVTLLLPPSEPAAKTLPWFGDVQLEGPLGMAWTTAPPENPAIILASGLGIGAALALIDQLKPQPSLVLLDGGGLPLPFRPQPSLFVVNGLPPSVIAAAPPLEEHEIPSRLADPDGSPGCFEGTVLELFRCWLAHQPSDTPLEVFACLADEPLAELRTIPSLRIHVLGAEPLENHQNLLE